MYPQCKLSHREVESLAHWKAQRQDANSYCRLFPIPSHTSNRGAGKAVQSLGATHVVFQTVKPEQAWRKRSIFKTSLPGTCPCRHLPSPTRLPGQQHPPILFLFSGFPPSPSSPYSRVSSFPFGKPPSLRARYLDLIWHA